MAKASPTPTPIEPEYPEKDPFVLPEEEPDRPMGSSTMDAGVVFSEGEAAMAETAAEGDAAAAGAPSSAPLPAETVLSHLTELKSTITRLEEDTAAQRQRLALLRVRLGQTEDRAEIANIESRLDELKQGLTELEKVRSRLAQYRDKLTQQRGDTRLILRKSQEQLEDVPHSPEIPFHKKRAEVLRQLFGPVPAGSQPNWETANPDDEISLPENYPVVPALRQLNEAISQSRHVYYDTEERIGQAKQKVREIKAFLPDLRQWAADIDTFETRLAEKKRWFESSKPRKAMEEQLKTLKKRFNQTVGHLERLTLSYVQRLDEFDTSREAGIEQLDDLRVQFQKEVSVLGLQAVDLNRQVEKLKDFRVNLRQQVQNLLSSRDQDGKRYVDHDDGPADLNEVVRGL